MLKLSNTVERYGLVAVIFHWGMAVLILVMLALGLYMEDLPLGPEKLTYYGWHKAWGTVVLGLVLLRFSWRLTQLSPPLPPSIPNWQVKAAHVGHMVLYGLMVAMPLTGWMMSSAAGFPVSVFGWFTLPNLVAPDPELKETFVEIHEYLAYIFITVIAGHIGAVVLHYIQKEPILRRMLPW
jgi:cytochrome b561